MNKNNSMRFLSDSKLRKPAKLKEQNPPLRILNEGDPGPVFAFGS